MSEPRHPGYGPNPPSDRPAYTPEPTYPQSPAGYATPPVGNASGQAPFPPQGHHPGYGPGAPYGAGPSGAARPQRTLGLIALVLAAIAAVLSFILTLVQAGIVYSTGPSLIGVLSGANQILTGLLAIGAVIVGALAVRRRDAGSILGAMGLGGGAVILIGVVSGLLYPVIVSLSYELS